MSSDRIEKVSLLKAPQSRVWRALTDAEEFSQWFGIRLEGPFVVGAGVRAVFPDGDEIPEDMRRAIQSEEMRLGLPHAPVKMPAKEALFCWVEKIEPERYFAFRWVPYGIDASIGDAATEPTTLVEFFLEAKGADETLLKIVESGFDKVPAHRRHRAFKMNEGGWARQSENLKNHVEGK